MTRFGDYATKYQTIRMERRDGILQMTFHTSGGPLQWGLLPHGERGRSNRHARHERIRGLLLVQSP